MNKYIAVLGMVDEVTTEEITLKEIGVNAKDQYEAHKTALFKCNLSNQETVFKIKEASTGIVRFDHKTGFIS
jgi:hypothetical protein